VNTAESLAGDSAETEARHNYTTGVDSFNSFSALSQPLIFYMTFLDEQERLA